VSEVIGFGSRAGIETGLDGFLGLCARNGENMVEFLYAQTADGTVVDADTLAQRGLADADTFFCIACDHPLIPKVKGTQRRPHFAHHPGTTCNPETYLHRLGKQLFADVFNECVEKGEPFFIELTHPSVCRKFEDILGSPCNLEKSLTNTYDLTHFYNEVRLEKRQGEFIPDLLLFNRERLERRLFIEIVVTHFLSEKKERSSERIIEIPLESEADLEKIRCRRLTSKTARFLNFVTEDETVTDSDCACTTRLAQAFIIYDSGRCILKTEPLGVIGARRVRQGGKIEYFRILHVQDLPRSGDLPYMPSGSNAFQEGVKRARADGFPLKNCYLCKYHGNSRKGDPDSPVYCKCFKKDCNSNAAVDCEAFREPSVPFSS